jgi:plastocyanin
VKFSAPSARSTHWLAGLLVLSLSLAACADRPASDSPASEADGPIAIETNILGFAMSAASTHAGPVTFNVTNTDDMPHDFALSGNGVEYTTNRLQPGERESFTLELPAGTYTYLCTLEGHGTFMKGTFTVNG